MSKIKTKESVKDIKALDKAAELGRRMKNAFIRSKDTAANLMDDGQTSPGEYAEDKAQYAAQDIVRDTGHTAVNQGKNAIHKSREFIRRLKELRRERPEQPRYDPHYEDRAVRAQHIPGETESGRLNGNSGTGTFSPDSVNATDTGAGAASGRKATTIAEYAFAEKKHIKEKPNDEQLIYSSPPTQAERGRQLAAKQSERPAGRTSVKTADKSVKRAGKSIKTAEQSAKTSVKTAEASAKAMEKGAQSAAKASQKTAQAARATAKAAAKTAETMAKAASDAVKASAESIKSLTAAIGAGSVIAVIIVVLICLIGMIAGSAFGIFFSSQPNLNSSETMFQVVREINDEYINRIENIKATAIYNDLEITGSRAVWKDVLSVYAVKTATDPMNAQDVATMTPQKKQILNDIFWAMNSISCSTGIYIDTQYVERDDGKGNITVEEVKVLLIRLYITVSHRTTSEMAAYYWFSSAQKARLSELLSDEYSSLWNSVLYGIDATDDAIVAVALSQLGNVGGATYWSWYGFTSHVDWCACFVSWCANECGYIESGIIPQYASCRVGIDWFQSRDQWAEPDIEPSPGMVIFFDWDKDGEGQDGVADHTGIVEKVEGGYVYTIEGNSGDTCRECGYPIANCGSQRQLVRS